MTEIYRNKWIITLDLLSFMFGVEYIPDKWLLFCLGPLDFYRGLFSEEETNLN